MHEKGDCVKTTFLLRPLFSLLYFLGTKLLGEVAYRKYCCSVQFLLVMLIKVCVRCVCLGFELGHKEFSRLQLSIISSWIRAMVNLSVFLSSLSLFLLVWSLQMGLLF